MSLLLKRWLDLLLATISIIVFSPLMIGVAIFVLLNMGSPILFRHVRAGYRGKPFVLLKFRTMNSKRNAQGVLLPDGERLTRAGQFLRRFSLDELPQLWNVCKGEMSLVGPRPLMLDYLERYTPQQARRHEVKPGITGWAQVNGRNNIDWEDKFRLDVWYVDHWSLRLDASIVLSTFQNVLIGKGISNSGHATMPEFTGRR